MTITIESERPGDSAAIEALLDEAFGADRHKKQSYRYRRHTGPVAALSLVARDGGRVIGTVRYWPVTILAEPRAVPALLLGPIGVSADRRKEKVGDRLMRESLRQADVLGHRIVLLVGDLSYYGRFGFRSAAAHGIFMPGEDPRRLQLLELDPGALAGVAGDLWPVSDRPASNRQVRARRYAS